MALSWTDAQKAVLDPGSGTPFELTETEVFGVKMEVFKNAPPNLALALQGARNHGDATFLLYEGERYSFARVMDEVDGLAHLLVNTYGVKKGDRVAVAAIALVGYCYTLVQIRNQEYLRRYYGTHRAA